MYTRSAWNCDIENVTIELQLIVAANSQRVVPVICSSSEMKDKQNCWNTARQEVNSRLVNPASVDRRKCQVIGPRSMIFGNYEVYDRAGDICYRGTEKTEII